MDRANLDILTTIIGNDLRVYRRLALAIPWFGRSTIGSTRWKTHFAKCIIDGKRATVWKLAGSVHRDDDKPAIISANGDKFWYQRGKLHRGGDLPAVVTKSGKRGWWQHGKCHRDGDKPAIISK